MRTNSLSVTYYFCLTPKTITCSSPGILPILQFFFVCFFFTVWQHLELSSWSILNWHKVWVWVSHQCWYCNPEIIKRQKINKTKENLKKKVLNLLFKTQECYETSSTGKQCMCCNYKYDLSTLCSGLLSFYNAKTKQLMHTFKSKFPQPVIPAFMVRNPRLFPRVCFIRPLFGLSLNSAVVVLPLQVWNGSFSVVTGLQVPSMVQSGQRRNSGTSSSNASVN